MALDIDASIIPTSEANDDVTSTNNKSTLVLLVTKYGLQLHVSHDATVEISIQHPPPLEKSVHGRSDARGIRRDAFRRPLQYGSASLGGLDVNLGLYFLK